MNEIGKAASVMVLAVGFLLGEGILYGSPIDDLGSPSQERRDAAAKILRKTYTPPPRKNWDALVRTLQLGTPQTNIEARLRSSNLVSGMEWGSGITHVKNYRLDTLWILECSFTNTTPNISNSALYHVGIKEQLRDIWVEPPTNFTGVWRTYWANGQLSTEIKYNNGRRDGEDKTFYTDGSICVLSHVINDSWEGEETAFYPSGRIKYKGQYKGGSQAAQWVWYNEDGSIQSKKDYPSK
jgi:hypothetical protein